jgi:hypothetical protein
MQMLKALLREMGCYNVPEERAIEPMGMTVSTDRTGTGSRASVVDGTRRR